MKDTRRCCICGLIKAMRKNGGTCSSCIDLLAKFKDRVNSSIYSSLKYGIKSYILDYLPYSIQELKEHLEKQFEPWMTWENRGKYNSKNWNDNDQSTWTWQIDHIIPQANFSFLSIRDINFTDCWSLNNLRPLSSKKNAQKHIKEKKIK